MNSSAGHVESISIRSGMRFPKRYAAWAAKTRVAVSGLLAITVCLLARPTQATLQLGIAVAVAGLLLRVWAAGHLQKNKKLTTSGPYAFVRNPLYLGSMTAGVGLGIGTGIPLLALAILTVFILWFLPVMGEEEDHIRKILPGYSEYEKNVPRLIPSLLPRIKSDTRFEWKLFIENREYSALLGFGIIIFILWLKVFF